MAAIGAVCCMIYGNYVEFFTFEFWTEFDEISADSDFFTFFNIYAFRCNCMSLLRWDYY